MQIRNPERVAIVGVVMLTLGAGGYWLGTRSAKDTSNTRRITTAPVRKVRAADASQAKRSVRDRRHDRSKPKAVPVRHERERHTYETRDRGRRSADRARTPVKKKPENAS